MYLLTNELLFALLPLLPTAFAQQIPPKPRSYDTHDYYALHLTPGSSPEDVARHLDLNYVEPIGRLDDHFLFKAPTHEGDQVTEFLRRLRKRGDYSYEEAQLERAIKWSDKQVLRQRVKRLVPPRIPADVPSTTEDTSDEPSSTKIKVDQPTSATTRLQTVVDILSITDPEFPKQWHLLNTLEPGNDMNVTGLWLEGITGHNATVAIVDDGLDMESHDLKANFYAKGSWDFNDPGPLPKPRLSDDRHGTRCAGEVAAVKNDVCGVGVAYDSKVAGIRILSKLISDADEAISLNYEYETNNIYSCSWGPTDDGMSMEAPSLIIKKAVVNGIQKGREGRGSIFVFASGNGAGNGDNCNFDGYTNSIYSVTVSAVDRVNGHPYYAESCSANLVVTYSSGGGGDAIHTTDVGINSCVSTHGGTSAAAPLAAGVFALALSVRPELTWRDIQYLCVMTAVPVDEEGGAYVETTIGRRFSHQYGYGKIDAYELVHRAMTWDLVKPQAWWHSPVLHVDHEIPQNDAGLVTEMQVTADDLKKANIGRLEHVTVTCNAVHTRRGDMSVSLISPNGIISYLATERPRDNSKKGYIDWTFMSVQHWGEDGIGIWKLLIHDTTHPEENGTFIDWQLNLWGEATDGSIQGLHPLPGSDETHNEDGGAKTTTHVGASTTSGINVPTTRSSLKANPTDHIDRPVNSKPGDNPSSSGTGTTATADMTTAPTTASGTPTGTAVADEGSNKPSFLPSFFPTFGVGAKTQVWVYGALAGIVILVSGLGIYLCVQKRKQRGAKDGMDAYEFAVLDNEGGDAETGQGLISGKKGKKGPKRGRELYDAFAASDEEDAADLSSDDELHRGRLDESDDEEDESSGSYQDTPSEKVDQSSADSRSKARRGV